MNAVKRNLILALTLTASFFSVNAFAVTGCEAAGNTFWDDKVTWGNAYGHVADAKEHGVSPNEIASLTNKCNELNRPIQGDVDAISQNCKVTDACRAAITDLAQAAEDYGTADGRESAAWARGASDDERYKLLMKANALGIGMQKYFDEFSRNCELSK